MIKNKDALMSTILLRSVNLFFGKFVPKNTFNDLLKKDGKTQSEHALLVSHLSMALSIGYATLGFLIGIILYAMFLIINIQFLADFSLWFFVGIGFSLGTIGAIKYMVIKNFQTVHGIQKHLPEKYLYGMRDVDIIFGFIGGLIIGLLATIISTPVV